ncbi:hypothetical protein KJ903_00370, partial [Patescibacteria group bacterium]|nr:hypothetical protein [Patescibacteria group bacterium]
MKINYVVPPIHKDKFTGGLLCIFEYLNGLAKRGHEVTVVPTELQGRPQWYDLQAKIIRPGLLPPKVRLANNIAAYVAQYRNLDKKKFVYYNHAVESLRIAGYIPDCDINIATSYETALPVYLSGQGRKFYFMQHFEQLFVNERMFPDMEKVIAQESYLLPLQKIANSSWLQAKLESEFGGQVAMVNNAINLEVFCPHPIKKDDQKIRILSYGGRNAVWKGFREAAEA